MIRECIEFEAGVSGLRDSRLECPTIRQNVEKPGWFHYAIGGQTSSCSKNEGYLGFSNGISGAQLAENAREQALQFGAEARRNCERATRYSWWAAAFSPVAKIVYVVVCGPSLKEALSQYLVDGIAASPIDPDRQTGERQSRVFAAGDVWQGSVKRGASAFGEGAMAGTLVHRYLAGS
jgi:thioredoxin reductase